MRITDLCVHGFGVWKGLRIDELDDGVTVFYGPNEAGKTTLMHFARSVLYGFEAARRRGYLPPLGGGTGGGSIGIAGPNGRFQIRRLADESGREEVALLAPDGAVHGEHLLGIVLSGVDEPIYRNVFAVGLGEMQQLGALSDTEAARLLYDLTSGMDRVPLVEVLGELEHSRRRVFDADAAAAAREGRGGGASLVSQLLGERKRLLDGLEALRGQTQRFVRLVSEADQLRQDIALAEEQAGNLEQQVHTLEVAASLGEVWKRRAALDAEIAALGPLRPIAENAVEQLDQLNERVTKARRQHGRLRKRRDKLARAARRLPIREVMWRLAPQIEALAEQAPWIESVQQQIERLDEQAAAVEADMATCRETLGLDAAAAERLVSVPPERLRPLRRAARVYAGARRAAREARRRVDQQRGAVDAAARQLESALAAHQSAELSAALDAVGNLVGQLRRRIHLDQRLEQLRRAEAEMQQQIHQLLGRHVLPGWPLMAMGGVFVVGFAMVLAGLLLPAAAALGWPLAILGALGCGGTVGYKYLTDRAAGQSLDACRTQLEMLQLQQRQTAEECEQLDRQLPAGGGPPAVRLQAAEKQMAELELLMPLDERRQSAQHELRAAEARCNLARRQAREARRGWRQALRALALPEGLAPTQAGRIAASIARLSEGRRRIEAIRQEQGLRQRELGSIEARIEQLAHETGLGIKPAVDAAAEPVKGCALLEQLAEAAANQKQLVEQRDLLRRRIARLRAAEARYVRAARRARRRRRRAQRVAPAADGAAARAGSDVAPAARSGPGGNHGGHRGPLRRIGAGAAAGE